MNSTHLTQEERYPIDVLKKAGLKPSEIADVLERDRLAIRRELARNRGQRDLFFHHMTTQVSIDKSLGHLGNGFT